MPVGLHPAKKVRRVKRLGNREMRVRTPPWERLKDRVSPFFVATALQQAIAANAGKITSCRGFEPRRVHHLQWGPVAQFVEQDVFPKLRRRERNCRSSGNAGRDYIFVWIERRPCHSSSRCRDKAGECRWEYIGGGFGLRFESASSHHPSSPALIKTGECRSDYMGEHLREAGGRRFEPAPEKSGSSAKNGLIIPCRLATDTAANAGGTTRTLGSPVQVRPGH